MLPACVDPFAGNHGITSAITMPIAVANSAAIIIWTRGRLRTEIAPRTLEHLSPPGILCLYGDERVAGRTRALQEPPAIAAIVAISPASSAHPEALHRPAKRVLERPSCGELRTRLPSGYGAGRRRAARYVWG